MRAFPVRTSTGMIAAATRIPVWAVIMLYFVHIVLKVLLRLATQFLFDII
jgi:hypothetical protein